MSEQLYETGETVYYPSLRKNPLLNGRIAEPCPDYSRNCMTVPRYCSMTSLADSPPSREDISILKHSPNEYYSNYNQRRSFDDSFIVGSRNGGIQYNPYPGVSNWNPTCAAGHPIQKLGEETTVFRAPMYGTTGRASGEYCANSYFGWHQPMNSIRNSQRMTGSTWSLAPPTNESYLPPINPYLSAPPVMSTCSTSDSATKKFLNNKWALTFLLLLLVIIMALIIAAGIAIWSQVKTHSSVVKLVRQYRGQLMVVDGPLLEFDGQLLNKESSAFKTKAHQFQSRIDTIFDTSGLRNVYEGAEVTEFRFIVEVPAMEVYFNIKTKVDVVLNVMDILKVMKDGIKTHMVDAVVDLSSLTLESQRLTNTNL